MGVSDKHVCDECPANMYPPIWMLKRIQDLTLEDATNAHAEGWDFVCGNGDVKLIYNQVYGTVMYNTI